MTNEVWDFPSNRMIDTFKLDINNGITKRTYNFVVGHITEKKTLKLLTSKFLNFFPPSVLIINIVHYTYPRHNKVLQINYY